MLLGGHMSTSKRALVILLVTGLFLWTSSLMFEIQAIPHRTLSTLPHLEKIIQNFHQQHTSPQTPKDWQFRKRAENMRWARSYNLSNSSSAFDIQQTGEATLWVVKLSSLGTIQWQKTYGTNQFNTHNNIRILQPKEGGFIVTSDADDSASSRGISILKLFPDGNIDWQYIYKIGFSSYPVSIISSNDGGYIICCNAAPNDRNQDIVVFKIDNVGILQWTKKFGAPYQRISATSMVKTPDNSFVIAFFHELETYERYNTGIFKIDSNGNILWQKKIIEGWGYKAWGHSYFACLAPTSDGGYILTDYSSHLVNAAKSDYIITKLDGAGNIHWQKIYGSEEEDFRKSIIVESPFGGYLFAGLTSSFEPDSVYKIWILNLDVSGGILWEKTFLSDGLSRPNALIQAEDGDYVIAGSKALNVIFPDMLVLKFSPSGDLGPCQNMADTNSLVREATPTSQDSQLISSDIILNRQQIYVVPSNSDANTEIICWNLHQPPENVTVSFATNKSFLKTEYYNHITWIHSSWNDRFDVTHYRIYKDEDGRGYELIAEVGGSITEYLDGPVG